MPAVSTCLLASSDFALPGAIEPALSAFALRVQVELTAAALLNALDAPEPLALILLDEGLAGPGISEAGMEALLQAVRSSCAGRIPIVLICDEIAPRFVDWMTGGLIDDVIPRSAPPAYWHLRIGTALHAHRLACRVESLCQLADRGAQFDRLTGLYNREGLLAMFQRESDRVQRSGDSLSLLLLDIDDFGHWNSRLGAQACDDLLRQVATRCLRLLRSYDLIGRPGKDEFLIVLPGCSPAATVKLAERLRAEVFYRPFRVGSDTIRLSACFGIAEGNGRPPAAALREAEEALAMAREAGPEFIQCFGEDPEPQVAPVTFLSSTSGDELLAW